MTEPAGPALMPFDLWWSPSIGVWRHTPRGPMLTPGFEMVNDSDGEHFREEMPDDAVRLVLADPEQGSELEELRAERDTLKLDFNSSEEDLTDARREIAEVRRYLIDNWYKGDPIDGTLMLLIGAVKQIQRERDQLQARVAEQEQLLAIVRAQNADCVEQVDAALGHRYHTRGVHYSIPHVAEKAAVEIEQLQARIDKALALHTESKLYTECGHDHTDDDSDDLLYVDEVGTVCEDGYLVTICRVCCCTASGDQSEECTSHHDGPCWPCPTRAALLPGDETPQPEEDQP